MQLTRASNPSIGYSPNQVEFAADFERKKIYLILPDFTIPCYDGISAVALARSICHVPLLFVFGTIGEEWAIKSPERATDAVLKDRHGATFTLELPCKSEGLAA